MSEEAEWTMEGVRRLLTVFSDFKGPACDDLWWRTDGEYAPVTFLVNCNDLFFWGCADCERLYREDLDDIEAALADCRALPENEGKRADHYAALLWCARKRGMRPQWAFYQAFTPELAALFDAVSAEPGYGWPKEAVAGAARIAGLKKEAGR